MTEIVLRRMGVVRAVVFAAASVMALANPGIATAANISWLNTATVLAYPGHYLFNAGANWVGGVAPGSSDTAVFGATNTPTLSVDVTNGNTNSSVGGFTFLSGAPAYTFSVTNGNYLEFFGAGIVNGSGLTVTTTGSHTQFYNSSSADAAHFTIGSGGFLQFYSTSNAGTSAITNNSGDVQFYGTSSAGSSTINNSGYVAYFNTAGSIQANELNRIVNTSTGVIDLSNSTAGGVYIGSIAGSGSIVLSPGNFLIVGGNNDSTTYAGTLTGSSSSYLQKIGSGTLTMSNVTFDGNVQARGGTLIWDGGSIAGSVDIYQGGTFYGRGTYNPIITGDGTLAVGTPTQISTITALDFAFSPGSIYQVKIDGTTSDRLVGTAPAPTASYLQGAVQVKPIGVVTHTTTYDIFSAPSIFGTFNSVSIVGAPLARNPRLSYVDNTSTTGTYDVMLTVDAGLLSYIIPASSTTNQKNVAAAIDNALIGGAALPPGFQTLFNLVGPQLYAGINQASGQSGAGATQTSQDVMNGLMNALFDSFLQGRAGGTSAPGSAFAAVDEDEELAYAQKRKFTRAEREARNAVTGRNNIYNPRWSVWGTAYGGSTTTTGSATQGTNDVTSRVFGFVTGADYNLNARTTIGFALGGGGSNYGVAGNLGSGRAEMFQMGLFAKHTMGAAYVTGGLGYTFQNVTTDRTVTIAGTDQLRATFNANTFSARGEAGYRFATPVVGVTPYAALQVTNISLPSYGESAVSGNNTFALNYAAQDTTVLRTELGARFDRAYALKGAMLTVKGRAAWAHDEGNTRNVSAVFGSLPGSNFTVSGAVPSKDLALVSAGADIGWFNNITVSGLFEGQFSDRTTGFGGKGTVRYEW